MPEYFISKFWDSMASVKSSLQLVPDLSDSVMYMINLIPRTLIQQSTPSSKPNEESKAEIHRQVSAADKASGLEKGQYQVRVKSRRAEEPKMPRPKMPNPRQKGLSCSRMSQCTEQRHQWCDEAKHSQQNGRNRSVAKQLNFKRWRSNMNRSSASFASAGV